MMEQLTAEGADPTFGIALIERGHEVGGGDHRASVATRVEILGAEEFEDGRWGVVAAGLERVDIIEWLPDDPYPLAMVRSRPVVDNGGSNLEDVGEMLREVIEMLAAKQGVDVATDYDFSDEPLVHLDQLCALAPLTDFDRQFILEASTTRDQMERLSDSLQDKRALLEAQLGHGDELG